MMLKGNTRNPTRLRAHLRGRCQVLWTQERLVPSETGQLDPVTSMSKSHAGLHESQELKGWFVPLDVLRVRLPRCGL